MNLATSIDAMLAPLTDWRGDILREYRVLFAKQFPELTESFKWGVPVYSGKKLVLAMSAFKDIVKINFFEGAFLPDPHKLFNNGLDSKKHRSIDMSAVTKPNQTHLIELIKAAIEHDAKKQV